LNDIRDLVETVTLRRDPTRKGGIEIIIAGWLNALLGEKAFPHGSMRFGGMLPAKPSALFSIWAA
jgi:site-specific DNA recombinase